MSYLKFIIISIFCIFLFNACGLNETVVQKEKISYLVFTGNVSDVVVHIDDLEPITMNGAGQNIKYEISSGKHHIVVFKNKEKLVDRIVLLGSGSAKEIKIP